MIHGPDIPGPCAILLFTASDPASITSHIHNWILFLLWLDPFILSGVISPLISSSIWGTYWPGEFLFQYPIILPFHSVHGVLKARILRWFASPFSSGPHSVLFIIGDWDAKVGSQETPGVTGKFGLGIWNETGQRLIEFCQENAPVIANTLFQQHKRRLYTCISPEGQHQNQIDYILCSQRWRSYIQSAKTRLGADCGSDHELLIAKFKLKLKKVGKTTRPFRYDLNQIPYDYTVEVRNKFKGLDLIDRVPDELRTEVHDIVPGDRDQDHPHGKEMKKSKMAVWGGLTNSCEKKRSEKQRRKGKI